MRITDRRYRRFRAGILLRDGRRCRYRYDGCTLVATQVEHLVPRSRGGGLYDEGNCYSVCHSCHREKERLERAGQPVDAFLRADVPGDAPSFRTHTQVNRRKLLVSGDYSRRRARRGDAAC